MPNTNITLRALKTAVAAAVAAAVLTACGGGGAGDTGTLAASESVMSAASGAVQPGSTAAASVSGPAGQDANSFALSFSEDFDGPLNTSQWNDKIWYEADPDTKNYSVEDGKLKIWPQRNAAGEFFNRTIDTDGKFYQTYGYFEVEAKLPVGKGTWPAFWLFNHIDDRRPEIDIMEAYAGGGPESGWSDSNMHPTSYGATIWKDASVNGGFGMVPTPDLSAGFHKFGLKWEANRQTFYFDGQEVYSQEVTMGDPMYMMLDLWFGSASGAGDQSTPTGKDNSYEVNYVRAWKFK
jgi:beta-glucanase (GH16 family)